MRLDGARILLVVVAVLMGLIAGALAGFLAYDGGNIRKSVSCGLYAFGATVLGIVTIEAEIGLYL